MIGLHLCAGCMGLFSFKFVQWAPKHTYLMQQSVCRKRILAANSCSRSFKVTHFAINYRPTRVSIPLCNIAGLISKDSEEVAIQMTKYCRRRPPHSHLTPPPANIPINLIFPETRMIGLHFCRRFYGSIFIQIYAMGSKRRIFAATECLPKTDFGGK